MSNSTIGFKKLTTIEWHLLKMLAKGKRPSDISKTLSISVKKVSRLTSNLEKKMGVTNRIHLQKLIVNIKNQADSLHAYQNPTSFTSYCLMSKALQ